MTPWQWERPDTLAERLWLLRTHFNLSAAAAADEMGLSDQTWRNWEASPPRNFHSHAIAVAMRFERDGDKARDLAGWLLNGGSMPPRPEPPYPFVRHLRRPGRSASNRCCMHSASAA